MVVISEGKGQGGGPICDFKINDFFSPFKQGGYYKSFHDNLKF